MVATTLTVAAGTAAVVAKLAPRLPMVHKDPRMDAGIKAAVGLAAILASMKVKNETAKGAMIGAGAGLAANAAGTFVPFLA